LTSGFPEGLTSEFSASLRKYYLEPGYFVFVSSDFEEHEENNKYAAIIRDMLEECGIVFNGMTIVDDRLPRTMAIEKIEEASVVWISGGDTLKQIHYLKACQLVEVLRRRQGITIGMSAGSINMAERVVLAKDLTDNIPSLSIYDGIGLVQINIEPHINYMTSEHLEEIKEATKVGPIIGLPDNSFIVVTDDQTEYIGDYMVYERNFD
jgi:dipeptidase E